MGWLNYEAGRIHNYKIDVQLATLGSLISTNFTEGTNNLKGLCYRGSGVYVVGGVNGELCEFSANGNTCSAKDADAGTGFDGKQITSIAYSAKTGTIIAAGEDGKIVRKAAGGAYAAIANGFSTYDVNIIKCDENGVFHAAGENGLYQRSTDDGATWATVNIGFGTIEVDNIYCGPYGTVVVSGHSRRVNRSVDSGVTWEGLKSTKYDPLDALWCVAGDGKGIVVLGCYDTSTSNKGKIAVSGDNGASFGDLIPTTFTTNNVRPIRMTYADGTWVMVGDSATIAYSHNLTKWTQTTSHPFSTGIVFDCAYNTAVKDWLFVGATRRVARSGAATD